MCGNKWWSAGEDRELGLAIWRVCVATGRPPMDVVHRLETLMRSPDCLCLTGWTQEQDDFIRMTFAAVSAATGRSPLAAARRGQKLVRAAQARARRKRADAEPEPAA